METYKIETTTDKGYVSPNEELYIIMYPLSATIQEAIHQLVKDLIYVKTIKMSKVIRIILTSESTIDQVINLKQIIVPYLKNNFSLYPEEDTEAYEDTLREISTDHIKDLWPTVDFTPVTTPLFILRLQGKYLGQKTKNILRGRIDSIPKKSFAAPYVDQQFGYTFYIVSKGISYQVELFQIYYSLTLYPAHIFYHQQCLEVQNENELISQLALIFNEERTKKLLSVLYSMSVEEKS